MNISAINKVNKLCLEWAQQKEIEKNAIEQRRAIEDEIKSMLDIPETFEGSKSIETGSCMLKITSRFDKKVDSDKVQEIAAEHGLTDHLFQLFRWKAEINAATWKSAGLDVTMPFMPAITTKPSRASFTITKKEGE